MSARSALAMLCLDAMTAFALLHGSSVPAAIFLSAAFLILGLARNNK